MTTPDNFLNPVPFTPKGFTTYHGKSTDQTILHLTDGSTVGMKGDKRGDIARAIRMGMVVCVTQSDGMEIIVNPAHVIGGYYTPKDAE